MIYGKQIRLRHIEREDLPRFVQWFADPDVVHGLETYFGYSIEQERIWFEEMIKRPAEEQVLSIDVQLRGGRWQHIGSTCLMRVDWRIRSSEYGIVIGDKRFWNKGHGTEITRTMLRHAFATLNLNRVYLRVHAPNARAIKAYERAGFTREACLREAEYRDGKYLDVYLFSILRREWEAAVGAGKEN